MNLNNEVVTINKETSERWCFRIGDGFKRGRRNFALGDGITCSLLFKHCTCTNRSKLSGSRKRELMYY